MWDPYFWTFYIWEIVGVNPYATRMLSMLKLGWLCGYSQLDLSLLGCRSTSRRKKKSLQRSRCARELSQAAAREPAPFTSIWSFESLRVWRIRLGMITDCTVWRFYLFYMLDYLLDLPGIANLTRNQTETTSDIWIQPHAGALYLFLWACVRLKKRHVTQIARLWPFEREQMFEGPRQWACSQPGHVGHVFDSLVFIWLFICHPYYLTFPKQF